MPESKTMLYLIQTQTEHDDRVLTVRFEICSDVEGTIISGTVDWQDGLSIFHSEHIDPNLWIEISTCMENMLKKAREIIGDLWDHDI